MKKGLIIVIVLLSIIILGLCAFIIYDKDLFGFKGYNKEYSNVEEKEQDTNVTKVIDINSDLVKDLVYPKSNSDSVVAPETFVLKNESVDLYSFSYKIASIVDNDILSYMYSNRVDCYNNNTDGFSLTPSDGLSMNSCSKYPADIIKSKFKKLFGPDIKYEPQNLEQTGCSYPQFYDSKTSSYYGLSGCGGVYAVIKAVSKTYKAELDGDYLIIYDYALISFEHDSINGVLLFKNYDSFSQYYPNMNKTTGDYVINSESEAQSKLEELINTNQAQTYIWKFKKQSDGKYYYYSSKWQ